MLKTLVAAATLVGILAACAHSGDMPVVRAGNDPDKSRVRDGGRAAGAGGSHAPGGTGLGSGTMGTQTFSGSGSAR